MRTPPLLMYQCSLWILTLALFPAYTTAQSDSWVEDSLAIYHQNIEEALGRDDFEKVIANYKVVAEEGSKSLDPHIFAELYQAAQHEPIKEHPEILGRIYHHIGNLEFYRSNMPESKSAFVMAMEQYKLAGMKKDVAGMAMNLGVLMERSSSYDSAIGNYEKALPIFREMKDTAAVASCIENIGLAYHYKGEPQTALTCYGKVDSILQTNTPLTSVRWASLWYNKSNVLSSTGEYDRALHFALKGLKLSEQLKNERYINIGYVMLEDVYGYLNDKENWLKYMRKAEVFAEKTGNGLRLSQLYYSLGYYYLEIHNLDSATYYAQLGLDHYSEINYAEGLSKGHLLKGNINFQKGDYHQAIKDFKIAIDHLSNPESKILADMYHSMGASHMKLSQFDEATRYLQQALDLRLRMGDMASLRESYQSLAECSKTQGDYQAAYEYLWKFKQYEDSVFNETKSKQIAEIQTQYETEKKDQAIANLENEREIQQLRSERQAHQIYLSLIGLALLFVLAFVFYNRGRIKQKANVMLEAKNIEIEKQNKEKEILLKEIHHRVKNNLQVISSLLSMQTRQSTDSKIVDAMKESQSRVKTMALIHEKLYQYDNLSRVNMKEYMNQLSRFLSQTFRTDKDINVITEVDDINLDIDTAVPLGLITNELLSNALKYAFQDMDQGEIKIVLTQHESKGYRLVISDTGKGLSKDLDIKKSKSLGLKLVHTLTRQINGELSIHSRRGTTFSIDFENTLAA